MIVEDLRKFVEEFRSNYAQHRRELEANTETKLIEPLFELLGWSKKDFVKREQAHRGTKKGFADYAFKIDDKIVFFLEVKKVGIPLDKEADKQVISYALSKRVPFAVSTNFEQLKIFCVESGEKEKVLFKRFDEPEQYISKFADLMLLSKSSFEQGLTLKEAEKDGRLKRRVSIDKPLLEDFMRIRSLIANDIEKNYPTKYTINEKDDIVQRIIDRLIFIRRCEDTGINPDNLMLEDIKIPSSDKAYPKLKNIFKRYDEVYNSGLFTPGRDNDCDKITIDGEIIRKLVYFLYESKDGTYIYNFDWIDADVLGQVYEQYLGKILAQTKSGKAKLKEGQAHRKEQGIYYTPTYIVDYIVKNTVGELLKDKKVDAKKIKILDPACGSGSFLIKAFDYLDKHLSIDDDSKQRKLDNQGVYSVKTEILKNNIYGVDLDNKAVEITKLNLLLKAAEKNRKLPEELDMHIKHGNSLIDDETVAGLNAFHWTGDFAEGSFDVVIGNPPYVNIKGIGWDLRRHFEQKYATAIGRFDLYILFIEKALKLLKEEGFFSFIIPAKFLNNIQFAESRKQLIEQGSLYSIAYINDKVFTDASVDSVIVVFKKGTKKPKRYSTFNISEGKIGKLSEIEKSSLNEENKYIFKMESNQVANLLINKIKKNTVLLKEIADVKDGIVAGEIKDVLFLDRSIDKFSKPLSFGKDLTRYSLEKPSKYVDYKPDEMMKEELKRKKGKRYGLWMRTPSIFEKPKILTRKVGYFIIASIDYNNYYYEQTLHGTTLTNNNYDLRYVLGLLNSKLFHYYYRITNSKGGNIFPQVRISSVMNLPIKVLDKEKQQPIIKLVDDILSLNKQLQEFGDKKNNTTFKLEEDIKRTDQEIDELVYGIYGITKEEKKIIEESLK